jgi:hypothetical protein
MQRRDRIERLRLHRGLTQRRQDARTGEVNALLVT